MDEEPFLGEIRLFAGTFAPRGWAFCDGQFLTIEDNQALYSLIGITYGGDGRTNFALPDLRGRLPLHQGTGTGLSPRPLGNKSGTETVTLSMDQMPEHSHPTNAVSANATSKSPIGNMLSIPPTQFYNDGVEANIVELPARTIAEAGSGVPHTNMMPSLCINFIIATAGAYPPRP